MVPVPSAPPDARRSSRWAIAIASCAIAAIVAADAHGRASRVPFRPSAELNGGRVAIVGSAADAVRLWSAAGLRGRHLLVLTGQWSRPLGLRTAPPTPTGLVDLGPAASSDVLDARSALYHAARLGIARRIDVVMPPSAFTHRLGEVAGQKELERADGAFRLTFHGLERRFSTPRAFVTPEESVLVLVEPTWFAYDAPDPLAWLSAAAVRSDLVLLALEDPNAGEGERRSAAAFAAATRAPQLEATR